MRNSVRRFAQSLCIISALVTLGACPEYRLHISDIEPSIGNPGEILTVKGFGFGEQRGEGIVRIAGEAPTASSYLEWRDDRISVRIPDFSDSGLVYVEVRGKKSNPTLFTLSTAVPRLATSPEEGVAPKILSLSKEGAPVGALIEIQGRNFGASRNESTVSFGWLAEAPASMPSNAASLSSIEASEVDYEKWEDREILVRVPDGAVSGNLIVQTPMGSSEPFFFNVTDKPGTKTYRDKRTYVVSYSVNIDNILAAGQNDLYLWTPRPISSSDQRGVRLLSRSDDPFVEDHLSASLYKLSDLQTGQSKTLSFSYIVESYAVETEIKEAAVRRYSATPVVTLNTTSFPGCPVDDPAIKREAERIVGRIRNPYTAAKRIYDFVTKSLKYVPLAEAGENGYALNALETKQTDAYASTLLFCALARASGIPAIPVSGFIVDRSRASAPHWWAEFWVENFGWIPVDPAAGAGAAPAILPVRDDAKTYYFGNIDSHRLAFSRTYANLRAMDPRGRTVARPHAYSLQAIWEEAVGNIEAYSSLWSDLSVTGVY